AAQRQLGRAEDIARVKPATLRRRRYRDAVDRQRQHGADRGVGEGEALAASAVAHLQPVARRDLPVEPALDELARRGDEPREKRVVSGWKRVLAGLQPKLDVAER